MARSSDYGWAATDWLTSVRISDPYDMISGDPSPSSIKARASPLLDFTSHWVAELEWLSYSCLNQRQAFQLPRSRNQCGYRRYSFSAVDWSDDLQCLGQHIERYESNRPSPFCRATSFLVLHTSTRSVLPEPWGILRDSYTHGFISVYEGKEQPFS